MNMEAVETGKMNVFERIIGVFTSPKETFEDINKKPTWFVPFILLTVVVLLASLFLMDIRMADQMAKYEAQNIPDAQMEVIKGHMNGPLKYVNLAFIPIMTLIGLQLGGLLGGAVVTEIVFDWPGVGSLMIDAIQKRDYPVVQGCVLLVSCIYVAVNTITDLAYGFLDPRIRLGRV